MIMKPEIEIDFTTNRTWHSSYVRTRHKNLRCFPCCSPYHKESSFCGVSVIIEVKGIANPKDWTVLGSLRRLQDEPYINSGEHLPDKIPETYQSNQLILANETKVEINSQQETIVTYEFVPPRRWKYNCRLAKHTSSQKHTFSIYMCKTESRECISVINSPTFQIKSAWRQTSETVLRPRIKETNEMEEEKIKTENTSNMTSLPASPTVNKPNQIMVQQQTNVLWPMANQMNVQSDTLLIQQNNAMYYNLMAQQSQNTQSQQNVRTYTQSFGSTTPLFPLHSATSSLNLLIAGSAQNRTPVVPQVSIDSLNRPTKRRIVQGNVSQPMIPIHNVQFCQIPTASSVVHPNIGLPMDVQNIMVSKPLNGGFNNSTILTASSLPMDKVNQLHLASIKR